MPRLPRLFIALCGAGLLAAPGFAQAPLPTPLPEQTTPVRMGTAGLPWWNDHIFYQVFVRSFYDSDGDGTGDLQGLISRLDYLNDGDPNTTTDLGVTGLWLMPVTESPAYHGYHVTDYRQIEADYGSNDDFIRLIEQAHARGMVVIIDLVLNHTSGEHPWFLASREGDPDYDDWYIWSDENPGYRGPDNQVVWHRAGERFYYGLFESRTPDLNFLNPDVTAEMFDVARFWLEDMGVDGFRLDAVKHMIEEGRAQENTASTHQWMFAFHRWVRSINPDALLVGEIWTSSNLIVPYIGNEVDIAFEFDLAVAIIRSASLGINPSIINAQETTLALFPHGQYATFLTNHDQNRFMSQARENVGAARVAASILLTSSGVPFIYYGEEIGMVGQKPDERIRTPMQWDSTPATAGFTTGTPWQALQEGIETRNVAAQTADPDSLLSHYRALIHLRNNTPALRGGAFLPVDTDNSHLYAFVRHVEGQTVLVLINLSDDPESDYALTLPEGPLSGSVTAALLYGEGQAAAPAVNAAGGFEAYQPLAELAPYGTWIMALTAGE